jgi:hypothetical protein
VEQNVYIPRVIEVPPVELDEVELLGAEAEEGRVDCCFHIREPVFGLVGREGEFGKYLEERGREGGRKEGRG